MLVAGVVGGLWSFVVGWSVCNLDEVWSDREKQVSLLRIFNGFVVEIGEKRSV